MNKLKAFYIYKITKDALVEYLHEFVDKAAGCQALVTALQTWFVILQTTFAEVERLWHITPKSKLTELISLADSMRDGIITGLKHIVLAFEKSSVEGQREAARLLMVGLSSIKLNRNDQYITQTGQIDNLLYFLMVQEAAAVETLGIGSLVQILKGANDRMHDLLEGRVTEFEDKETGAFEIARRNVEDAYRNFVDSANAWALLNADRMNEGSNVEGQMSPAQFFSWANARIDFFSSRLMKEPGSEEETEEEIEEEETETEEEETETEEEETEEETQPKKYTVTFLNSVGEVVGVREFEEGERITKPLPPTGYKWPADMPERMPAENITVTAVIDNDEW